MSLCRSSDEERSTDLHEGDKRWTSVSVKANSKLTICTTTTNAASAAPPIRRIDRLHDSLWAAAGVGTNGSLIAILVSAMVTAILLYYCYHKILIPRNNSHTNKVFTNRPFSKTIPCAATAVDDDNSTTTTTGSSFRFGHTIPFVVYQEADWRVLYKSLRGLEQHNHGLLLKISQAIQTADESADEYEWLADSDKTTSSSSSLGEDLQQRLDQLARVLEQDTRVLQDQLLVPFVTTPVLPEQVGGLNNNDYDDRQHASPSRSSDRTRGNPATDAIGNDGSSSDHAYDEAGQVVAHLVRDWTSEGKWIRASLYQWCCDKVQELYSNSNKETTTLSIMVPGAGLGRLAWDLATVWNRNNSNNNKMVVSVEAVEYSLSMAAAAAAIWQRRVRGTLHPYATDYWTNEVDSQQRFDAVHFPDVNLDACLSTTATMTRTTALADTDTDESSSFKKPSTSLSYTVSDFVLLRSLPGYKGHFDVLVTCFFIDTAVNLFDYIDTIRYLLADHGGYWVNVGPLQWHRNTRLPVSASQLRQIVLQAGFEIVEWSIDITPVEYRSSPPPALRWNTAAAAAAHGSNGGDEWDEHGDYKVRSTHYEAYRPLRFVLKWETARK